MRIFSCTTGDLCTDTGQSNNEAIHSQLKDKFNNAQSKWNERQKKIKRAESRHGSTIFWQ